MCVYCCQFTTKLDSYYVNSLHLLIMSLWCVTFCQPMCDDIHFSSDGLLVECRNRAARFVLSKVRIDINAYDHYVAIDRVHRIGQERTVFVTHFIVCTSTLSHSLHSVNTDTDFQHNRGAHTPNSKEEDCYYQRSIQGSVRR